MNKLTFNYPVFQSNTISYQLEVVKWLQEFLSLNGTFFSSGKEMVTADGNYIRLTLNCANQDYTSAIAKLLLLFDSNNKAGFISFRPNTILIKIRLSSSWKELYEYLISLKSVEQDLVRDYTQIGLDLVAANKTIEELEARLVAIAEIAS